MENHLLVGALHIEHAFVAEHLGTIDVDDGAKEVFQLGGVKLAFGFIHKALHVVIVVVMVAVVAVFVVYVVVIAMLTMRMNVGVVM